MNELAENDLFDFALMKPCKENTPPDTLCIVSGYASHALASSHILGIKALGGSVKIDLIYGMSGVDGVRKIDHKGFIALHDKSEYSYNGSFDCRYVRKPRSIHAKVYVWCRHGVPIRAFSGSANYTNKGFKSATRVEVLSECDPVTALDFFNKHLPGTVLCQRASICEFVTSKRRSADPIVEAGAVVHVEMDKASPFFGCSYIDVPLRNARGHFGEESGLNWGLDKNGMPRLQYKNNPAGGRRDPDEAYIRFPKVLDCGFFPAYVQVPKGKKSIEAQTRFSVLTDDNEMFSCIRASGGYGKEIETPQDNAELGRWFRKRLGLPSGALITPAIMRAYGRESVRFYKIEDDQFFMDFSRPK